MRKERRRKGQSIHPNCKRAVVVGAAHLDIFADGIDKAGIIDKRGKITVSGGGTAYNIACNLMQFGVEVKLITLMRRGSLFTNILLSRMDELGLDKSAVILADTDEAGFIAYRNKGDLREAITASPIGDCFIDACGYKDALIKAVFIVVDLNNSLNTILSFIDLAAALGKPLYLMGVSEVKALKLAELKCIKTITGIFMSRAEASYLLRHVGGSFTSLSAIIPALWVVTKDKDGVSLYKHGGEIINYPAPQIKDCVSFSGAGDAFSAGFIYSKEILRMKYIDCIRNANNYVREIICRANANLCEQNILYNASEIVYRDPLTGLLNRKFLESEKSHIESQAADYPTCMAVFDIDNFKRINDSYGHDTGDKVLKVFGQIIKEAIRQEDIAVRFGGEEFIVILPGSDYKTALKIADRIRVRFKSKIIKNNGQAIQTTVSGGISYFRKGAVDIDKVFKEADKALYDAKKSGKDRICQFNESLELHTDNINQIQTGGKYA